MGALAAAVTKQNQDATPAVTTMLNELTHRGNKGHGLATPTPVTNALTIEKLATDLKTNVVIGHNYSKTLPRDILQPVHGDKYTLIFEGHQYPAPNLPGASDTGEMLKKLGSSPTKNAYNIVEKTAGSYVFAVAQPDRLTVGRDVFGTISLYYAENGSICAVASERKALWKLGLTSVESFPPGHIATVTPRGFTFTAVKTLYTPPKSVVDMQTASEALELLLLDATRRQVSDLDHIAVAFSGGVDSSIVAVLAKNVGVNVQLVAVGLENQHDVELAEQAAEALALPLHTQTYTVDDLKQTLPKALWLTEENHAVNACISVPFYWLAQTTQKLGHNVLLAGQGADELFGGGTNVT
jgi:asparagine synthase (glutamine-hydrolysing)